MVLNRDLLKIQITEDKPNKEDLLVIKNKFMKLTSITEKEADYFVFKGKLKNQAYSKSSAPIYILKKELLLLRIKITSGDKINLKDYREKKKKVAVIFTKLNKKI
jgi:ribosomal protein L29